MMAQAQRPHLGYIDGLRSIAVLPVVLFHAGFDVLGGGFVGVDVFFVISGFLITDHLARELADTGRISIADFYERRIRRIFPALFAVIAVTLLAGSVVMMPDQLSELAKSTIAATFFVSNFYFLLNSDYFATSSLYQPLLHTWSLAVEEQYYIFWPLLLWWAARFGKRWWLPLTIALTVLSFALSTALLPLLPSATFYMLPTRAWELLAGALLALTIWRPARFRAALAWLGIGLILATVFGYTEAVPFPGLAALPPVLGSVLIIAAADGTSAGRLLGTLPLRAIGLISYSLYLWHWPIIVFARLQWGPTLPLGIAVASIMLATVLATLSWRFVEQPFRRRRERTKGPFLPLMAGAVTMAVASVAAAALLGGLPQRLPANVAAIAAAHTDPDLSRYPCFSVATESGKAPKTVAECLAGGTRPKIVIWGDSHLLPFAPVLQRSFDAAYDVRIIGRTGCMPLADVRAIRGGKIDPGCSQLNREMLDQLPGKTDVSAVIIVGRWARLFFADENGEAQRLVDNSGARQPTGPALRRSFDRIFTALGAERHRVIVLGDVPEMQQAAPACLARVRWLGLEDDRCPFVPETLPGSASSQLLSDVQQSHQDVRFSWPQEALCEGRKCMRWLAGKPVLRDFDHLTDAAATFVAQRTGITVAPALLGKQAIATAGK